MDSQAGQEQDSARWFPYFFMDKGHPVHFSRIYLTSLAIFAAVIMLVPAYAQDAAAPANTSINNPKPEDDAPITGPEDSLDTSKIACEKIGEMIIPLKLPAFGGSILWRRVQGIMGEDRFTDILQGPDQTLFMVGETKPYTPGAAQAAAPVFFFLATDPAGKPLWEKRVADKMLDDVKAAVMLDNTITVLNSANEGDGRIASRISFFDTKGNKTNDATLRYKDYNLHPRDIAVDTDAKQYLVAAWAVSRSNPDDNFTIMYRLTEKGGIIWQKQYMPGVENRLETIYRMQNGQIIGAGRVRTESNKNAGWFLKLSDDGDIMPQLPYTRGAESLLRKGLETPDGGVVMIGDVLPADGGARASWVMRLNASGTPVWQRFIAGKYSYAAMDSIVYPDGRINVLLAGKPTADGGREHARILTFSAEGFLLADESYIEKSNSMAVRILPTDKGRIIVGLAQSGFADQGIPDNMRLTTYDAWAAGLQDLPKYNNPCQTAVQESLDSEDP